uniref:Peptidase S1 domain-containing protein n=1 Tax=Steinernema glaseri TaxID=37863 RepID=A0A1I8AFU9_9BILA
MERLPWKTEGVSMGTLTPLPYSLQYGFQFSAEYPNAFVHYGKLVRYSLVPFNIYKGDSTLRREVSGKIKCAQHALRSQKIAFGVVKKASGNFDCAVYSNIQGFAKKTDTELEVFLLDKRAPLSCQEQSWDEANFSGESSRRGGGYRGVLVISFFTGPRIIEDKQMKNQLEKLIKMELGYCRYADRVSPFYTSFARLTELSNGSLILKARSPFHVEEKIEVNKTMIIRQTSPFDYSTTTHVLLHVNRTDDMFIQNITISPTKNGARSLRFAIAAVPNMDWPCSEGNYKYYWIGTKICPEYTKGAPYMVFGPKGPIGLLNSEHMEQLDNKIPVKMHELCNAFLPE